MTNVQELLVSTNYKNDDLPDFPLFFKILYEYAEKNNQSSLLYYDEGVENDETLFSLIEKMRKKCLKQKCDKQRVAISIKTMNILAAAVEYEEKIEGSMRDYMILGGIICKFIDSNPSEILENRYKIYDFFENTKINCPELFKIIQKLSFAINTYITFL